MGEPPAGGVNTVRGIVSSGAPFLDVDDDPHDHPGIAGQQQARRAEIGE